ncbi:hypothetical protein MP638_001705 [Amoeboaphelidium occidentale]|nr:hypothetical protein MP638_001705 [Amoeboaphelidium occidentale]
MEESVKVYVRVKPSDGADEQLKYGEATVTLNGEQYSFDQVFGKHAKNVDLYNEIGTQIVKAALEDGINTCVFAYGQTGSSKTYSMFGVENDPGLIIQICRQLFLPEQETSLTREISVSYLEIYNEKVYDLLSAGSEGERLKIREHPTEGVYVQALKRVKVKSPEEIFRILSKGTDKRKVAETKVNSRSSRSHCIVTIDISTRDTVKRRTLKSRIALVDLAGSERVGVSMTSGERLKEGGQINKSLVTLGLVIKALVKRSSLTGPSLLGASPSTGVSNSGQKSVFVPYRDSPLTYLLKENLGGNSKTFMLATVSAEEKYTDETKSTLRYASYARCIVNKTSVNLIEETILKKEEIERVRKEEREKRDVELREERAKFEQKINDLIKEIEFLKTQILSRGDDEELKKQLELSERRVEQLLSKQKKRTRKGDVSLSVSPSKLSEYSTYRLVSDKEQQYKLRFGETKVGSNPVDNDIVLNGEFIQPAHCSFIVSQSKTGDSDMITLSVQEIVSEDDKFLQQTLGQFSPGVLPSIFVNGNKVNQAGDVKLCNGDKILVGRSCLFEIQRFDICESVLESPFNIGTLVSPDTEDNENPFVSTLTENYVEEDEDDAIADDFSRSKYDRTSTFMSSLRETHDGSFVGSELENELEIEGRGSFRIISNSFQEYSFASNVLSLYAEIPLVEKIITEDKKSFLLYHLKITLQSSDLEMWTVCRRFSHFYALHKQLKPYLPPLLVKEFPSHFIVGGDEYIAETRRRKLEVYLNGLLSWLVSKFSQIPNVDCEYVKELFPFLKEDALFSHRSGMWVTPDNQNPIEKIAHDFCMRQDNQDFNYV